MFLLFLFHFLAPTYVLLMCIIGIISRDSLPPNAVFHTPRIMATPNGYISLFPTYYTPSRRYSNFWCRNNWNWRWVSLLLLQLMQQRHKLLYSRYNLFINSVISRRHIPYTVSFIAFVAFVVLLFCVYPFTLNIILFQFFTFT